MVTLQINGEKKQYSEGTSFLQIAEDYQKDYPYKIAAVIYNGKIRELPKRADVDGQLEFVTIADDIGHMTYSRTALMMLVKAARDSFPDEKIDIKVEFTIGHGYYCTVKGNVACNDEFVRKVSEQMTQLSKRKVPIAKAVYPLTKAVEIFANQGMTDKVNLMKYRRSSDINLYCIEDFYDYFYGYMMPDTSYVDVFELEAYHDGILLVLPPQSAPDTLVPFSEREKLFSQMKLATDWGKMLGIENVADLNEKTCDGSINDMILVQEALQEHRIAQIAEHIHERKDVKFVMIAGPSSSGKTSFANRMSIQLRTYGLIPHPISLDNYFVDREKTPLNPDGSYNFECLEALDVERFNQDMTALLAGERVEMPTFNFLTGKREMKGDYMQLGANDILVIEGIHGLNDKMSYALPSESKFKIYISALTTLNVDSHNRISTTDGRLLRRLVRDARTRGASAQRTISMWPSVKAGELKNIYPYQESADEMFNSASIYELAILKKYAEPLLFCIKPGEPEYHEAKRLLKFLDYLINVDDKILPNNSLVREFVGGSVFKVD